MIQYIKFRQNPSFGSRYRVQTSFCLSKFDIQSAGVTFKMRSRSQKSNHFFPMPQWSFYASLVKIQQLVQDIECRQGLFLVFIVWWPWKLGQGHQNLLKSLNYPNFTIYEVWPESVIWFKRQGADRVVFGSKFENFSAGVTLKMRSRSPKSYHFFSPPNNVSVQVWSKSTHCFRR